MRVTTRKPVQRPKRLNTTLTDSHSTGKPVSQRESDCPECAGSRQILCFPLDFTSFNQSVFGFKRTLQIFSIISQIKLKADMQDPDTVISVDLNSVLLLIMQRKEVSLQN